MLDRNRNIKQAPEKFQENQDIFEVLVTCEERVFDAVVEDLLGRGGRRSSPVHVINVDIRDNHEDAVIGAKDILLLVDMVSLWSLLSWLV